MTQQLDPNGAKDVKLFDEDLFDLSQYWQTIVRYIWRILGLAIFLTILAALFAFH
jgi:uncharacterized protein involved in exopolysaccharide biosynthesis